MEDSAKCSRWSNPEPQRAVGEYCTGEGGELERGTNPINANGLGVHVACGDHHTHVVFPPPASAR